MAIHDERCKECKKHVFLLLSNLFGEVKKDYNLHLSLNFRYLQRSPYYSSLKDIYSSLQNKRGNKDFVKSKNLPNVDFYVVDHEFILEFDESQHFTPCRKLALEKYPEELKLGFDRPRWIKLCDELKKRDNDPIYRDEQRAWYDTLRDFAPSILKSRPTVRLYARDQVWCELDPDREEDLQKFLKILNVNLYNYKKTIVDQNPEYIDKKLLLSNNKKRRLFQTNQGSHIQVCFNQLGNLIAHEITNKFEYKPLDLSLRKIGIEYLDLNDPTDSKMIQFLVTPEMEVERIFNNLRQKYLESIYSSKLENPNEFISANYNNAFQSLAGLNVYQGSIKVRKDNDDFWKEPGFKDPSETGISFKTERNELKFILDYIRKQETGDYNTIYSELIAIKPGFHELYIHPDYFGNTKIAKEDEPRPTIFRLLRSGENLKDLKLKLKKLPDDIKNNNYFTYASCNVTEGPFVTKKKLDTSYFDEIRKIKSKEQIKDLESKFYILDYYHNKINSLSQLKEVLKASEKFISFI